MKRANTFLFLTLCLIQTPSLNAQQATPLAPRDAVSRELSPDQTHAYTIELQSNHFVYGVADQRGIDLVVTVYAPDGTEIGAFDGPSRGSESFSFETKTSGTYRIEVAPFDDEETGSYVLELVRVEPIATTPSGKVDQLMARYDRDDGPGAIAAVVQEGDVIFAKAYGMANLEHGVPLTRASVLDLGSVSKQFTAFAIAMLAERGELSLDDDIRKHLPEIPDLGHTVRIRHLIHHMSGIREIYSAFSIAGWQGGDGIAQEHALHLMRRQRELNFEPGTEYLYCNTAYMLLADIVSRVTDTPFAEWMQANIFEPVGMKHTTIMATFGQSIPGAAESYARHDGGYVRVFDNSTLQGAGGIYSTVDDLARWLTNYAEPQVGGAAVVAQMQQRGVLADGDTLNYAFGINIGEHRGLRRLNHGGASAGYRSSVAFYPELNAGVITLSNFASFDGSLPPKIAEAFFGDHMAPEEPDEEAPVADGDDAVTIDPMVLEDYVGEFELEGMPGVIVTVRRDGDRLLLDTRGEGGIELVPSSDSSFAVTGDPSRGVTFHREPDGSVARATFHQSGDYPARRVEQWSLAAGELAEYAGRYVSPELETIYTFVVEEGKLMAQHRRHADFELEPTKRDTFRGPQFLSKVAFERGADGMINGFRVSNGRVRNLWFGLTP